MIYEKSRTDLTQIKPFGGLSSRHLTVTPFPQERADVSHAYGVNGSKIGFDYVTSTATTSYYYVYNLQGDVISIIDTNNTTVVEYTYNEWGKLTATTDTLATTIGLYNPATSGGYYFMKEVAYLTSKGISMLPIF